MAILKEAKNKILSLRKAKDLNNRNLRFQRGCICIFLSITGDELGHLLSDSFALEQLELSFCNNIKCLKVPRVLLRLSYLEVVFCSRLQVIESEAPNLSSCCFRWIHHVRISLGPALHVKKLEISGSGAFHHGQLPTIMPSLQTLTINSLSKKMTSTPSLHSKFHQLKYLNIRIPGETHGPVYDYFSLALFLDASPCLETLILRIHVPESHLKHGLFSGDPSNLREMPRHGNEKLKRVQIDGFYPAKSLLELARHLLRSATSMGCLALGTNYCSCKFGDKDFGKCYLLAIGTYIEGKVPSTARLDVRWPCTGRCSGSSHY
ncbi:uncharacterized protein LOC112881147 [Panicum hallii]|uniref:uncharacterized protein LOC112881147 n=1 Tax=Panicum hallii TaxID=206008 RepID=UPI000DF4EA65|nr:uncharacterized protein LOC112881147 [Panicum hallii]